MKAIDILRSIENDVDSGRITQATAGVVLELFNGISNFFEQHKPAFYKKHLMGWHYFRVLPRTTCIAFNVSNGEHCELNVTQNVDAGPEILIDIYRPSVIEISKDNTYWVLATDEEIVTTFEIKETEPAVAIAKFSEYLMQY